jgi:hypothetical protein
MKRKTKFAPISKQYFFFKEQLEDLIVTISDEIINDGLDHEKISELIYTARQYSNRRNKYLKTSEATKGKK